MKKPKEKLLRFAVRLKGIGPESKKRLMSVGMNDKLELYVAEIAFGDPHGRGFDSPMFQVSVMEKQDELLKQQVECVVEEVKPKKGKR